MPKAVVTPRLHALQIAALYGAGCAGFLVGVGMRLVINVAVLKTPADRCFPEVWPIVAISALLFFLLPPTLYLLRKMRFRNAALSIATVMLVCGLCVIDWNKAHMVACAPL